jgi:hypothetical protein
VAWLGATRKDASARNLRRATLWLLGWLLVSFAIARAQLAEVAVAYRLPAQALLFDAGHARALAAVGTAIQVTGEQQQAMTMARAALAREPLNVAALRTLGLALEQTGDKAGANRIMSLAARLGWRDVALQLWLVNAYAVHGDVRSALRRADALARINRLPEITYPVFMASLTDDALRAALVQEMKDRPLWRGEFFYRLLQLPADQMRYVDSLIAELARAGSPINPAERAIYLTRLVQVGQGAAAYGYWLREQRGAGAAPSAAPWDGGFEHVQAPGALVAPFEWRIAPEATGVVSVVPAAGGRQLSVSAGRNFTGTLASQTLVLRPGRYRLTAQVGRDPEAAGLHWTIRCLPDQTELALDSGIGGPKFAAGTFDVPATGCNAQSLAIDVGLSGDGANNGDVTIDDVRMSKVG